MRHVPSEPCRSRRFVELNGPRRAMAACLAALAVTGCTQLGPAEQQALREANQLYNKGDLTGATAKLDRLIVEHDIAVEIAEAYYLRGLCRAKARQFGPATRDLETAVNKSKRDDLTTAARVSLASLAFNRGDWARTADLFEEVLPDMAPRPPKDDALYMAGVAMQRVGRWRQATLCFAEILNRFRDRPIAAQARRKAAWPHPYYSIQLGAFRDSNGAARAVREWRAKNLDATQESYPVQDQAMWVVMSGRYATYVDAVEALNRVHRLQPGAFIIP